MIWGYIHDDVVFLDVLLFFFPLTLISYLLKQIICNINLNLLYIKYSQFLVNSGLSVFLWNELHKTEKHRTEKR